jgi:hypothetical protein
MESLSFGFRWIAFNKGNIVFIKNSRTSLEIRKTALNASQYKTMLTNWNRMCHVGYTDAIQERFG